jgi:hypothetical protein
MGMFCLSYPVEKAARLCVRGWRSLSPSFVVAVRSVVPARLFWVSLFVQRNLQRSGRSAFFGAICIVRCELLCGKICCVCRANWPSSKRVGVSGATASN